MKKVESIYHFNYLIITFEGFGNWIMSVAWFMFDALFSMCEYYFSQYLKSMVFSCSSRTSKKNYVILIQLAKHNCIFDTAPKYRIRKYATWKHHVQFKYLAWSEVAPYSSRLLYWQIFNSAYVLYIQQIKSISIFIVSSADDVEREREHYQDGFFIFIVC